MNSRESQPKANYIMTWINLLDATKSALGLKTDTDLAEMLDCSCALLSLIRSGKRQPGRDIIWALFHIAPNWELKANILKAWLDDDSVAFVVYSGDDGNGTGVVISQMEAADAD